MNPVHWPVTWKGGVHVTGTPLWCDARLSGRGGGACFLSSIVSAGEARRHKQIIATEATLRLLPEAPTSVLSAPYGRPFTLGELRLEVFPSGFFVGSASLSIQGGGRRIVYAGAVNPRGMPLTVPAEVRPCDVLVVDSTFAHLCLPPQEEVQRNLHAWVATTLADGCTPVLVGDPHTTLPTLMQSVDAPIRTHRSVVELARVLGAMGQKLPRVRRLSGPPARGEVVLWPIAAQAPAIASGRRALVSGWAADPAVVARSSVPVDSAFPWAEQADRQGLLEYIAQSGAEHVYLKGPPEDDLAAALAQRGVKAWHLGPPTQLPLVA